MKILDALGVDDDRWTEIMTIAREAGERGVGVQPVHGRAAGALRQPRGGGPDHPRVPDDVHPRPVPDARFTHARNEADRLAGAVTFNADKAADGRWAGSAMLRQPGGPSYEVIIDELAIRAGGAARGTEGAALPHRRHGQRQRQDHVEGAARRRVHRRFSVPRSAFRSTPSATRAILPSPVDTVTDDLLLAEDDDVKRYDELYDRLRDACREASTSCSTRRSAASA